jgi:hypothetical protein
VHSEIVPGALADNIESVYERFTRLSILERLLKSRRRNPSCLILGTSCLTRAADALWLEMLDTTYIVAIYGERHQNVQRAAKVHNFPGTAGSAGNEDLETNVDCSVDLYCRISRGGDKYQGQQARHCHHQVRFHNFPPRVVKS